MSAALVFGAGGFIGSHLVRRLKNEGYAVRGVDLKYPEFSTTAADEFVIGDLRDPRVVESVFDGQFDRVYQLAADMGGAGFIFTGDNDAAIMHNSAAINVNVAARAARMRPGVVFYSSSVCLYPDTHPRDGMDLAHNEERAYPAMPTSEYGWEKIFSERLYQAFARNHGLKVKIARCHNTFGPEGAWRGGREKAPAALCRKVAEAPDGGTIEIWGDGEQTRPFIYIDDLLDGVERLITATDFDGPVDIGPKEVISIADFARLIMDVGGKSLTVKHTPGPVGVKHRRLDQTLLRTKLGWQPSMTLREGIEKTYAWIFEQVHGPKPGAPRTSVLAR